MTDTSTPYDALKNFNGLIHRQPLFISDKLKVDVYHLTFLETTGNPLEKDAPVPDFLSLLPQILPAINHRSKVLLTVPESWQKALCDLDLTGMELIIATNGRDFPPPHRPSLSFASYAGSTADTRIQSQTLLIDLDNFSAEDIAKHSPEWRQQYAVLCAVNVNALNQFSLCQQHDIDLLQGGFYTLPASDTSKKVSPSAQTLM